MPQAPPSRLVQVLVVDDSAVVREVIRTVLSRAPEFVVTSAADPIIARTKLRQMRPDVMVLDLEMPRMNGLDFLRQIMAEDPLPVVVCSSATGPGTQMALRALEEGAVEVMGKPTLGVGDYLRGEGDRLTEVIRALAQARPRRRAAASLPRAHPAAPASDVPVAQPRWPVPGLSPARPSAFALETAVVSVGASLGGPEALRQILAALPEDLPPIVIVQHMPAGFTRGFAERLDRLSRLSVGEALDGERLRRGRVLIAPGDRHLRVRALANGALIAELGSERNDERHQPSVDVLFRSVARAVGARALGVLLTGMGTDGAAGLLELREAGAHTIAQDEQTSVVFGMPGAAVARHAACDVFPLGLIAGAIAARSRSSHAPHEVGS